MTLDERSLYVGTMSGTSMDGLDLAAVKFQGERRPELITTQFTPYPAELQRRLKHLATNPNASLNESCELDSELGYFYASAINSFIDNKELQRGKIRAIGSHGQTIRHAPNTPNAYTLQIGDPNIIAATTGVNVVADFRRRDVALGGQGAPLASAFHNEIFRVPETNRAVINIGGISNITGIASNPSTEVVGFDCGPGNTFLDTVMQRHFAQKLDLDGNKAREGRINKELLSKIIANESYFSRPTPKTTGTDYFSPQWLDQTDVVTMSPADQLATLVELTVHTIGMGLQLLPFEIEECFVCGGGANNSFLMERLIAHLGSTRVSTTNDLGVHPDWVEAMAFAWLAHRTLNRRSGNLPSVTSAKKKTILGAVYFSDETS